MVDYVIGDVQGCYQPFLRLLDHLHFDENKDKLWFVGDLVNRGPQSLEVLRFIRALPNPPIITLGNHDLHLLARLFCHVPQKLNQDDSLDAILQADDREDLGDWLRQQVFLHHDPVFNLVICHAGIAPIWDLDSAKRYAKEVETALRSEDFRQYLSQIYGNEPNIWSESLQGYARLRLITNYFTRMRFCTREGGLLLNYKAGLKDAPADHIPWYQVPGRKLIEPDLVFGHWAALEGRRDLGQEKLYPTDTGCYWGGKLTALRLEDRQYFSVECLKL